jgi:ribonuclease P protein component
MSAQLHTPISHPPALEAPRAGVRFGITVSRHQARRAVARNSVKRVLREAARNSAAQLQAAAQEQGVDILLRLKAPLPDPVAATWSLVKAQLRQEADSLIAQLRRQLLAQSAAGGPPRADHPGGTP